MVGKGRRSKRVPLEGGSGSGVRRYGGKGVCGIGVMSHSCPRHIDYDNFYQTCAWVRHKRSTVSPVHWTLRLSPTLDG